MSGSRRQYTEKEVARVIRRAAEMQSGSQTVASLTSGVSEAELERIGAEVGLDSVHIRSALAELDQKGSEDGQTRWLGAPPEYEIERITNGPLTDSGWASIVGELNAEFKQAIEGVSAGGVRTWHWKHDLGSLHVTARQGPNGTRLQMAAHIDGGITVALLSLIFLMIVACAGVFALNVWFAPLIAAFVAIAGLYWFRSVVSSWYKKDQRKLNGVMRRLEDCLVTPQSGYDRALFAAESMEQQRLQG